MNMKKMQHWKDMLPIITAYCEGKSIVTEGILVTTDHLMSFTSPPGSYKIVEPPKYRAWTDKEVPIGLVVRCKMPTTYRYMIVMAAPGEVKLALGATYTLKEMFCDFTMDDGSPCGVKE